MRSLNGVDALVTGSSRGLGFGIAQSFAAAGARVWMVAEVADELESAAAQIVEAGGTVEARVVDLANPRARSELAREVLENAPRLQVLVNNAAVLERQVLGEMDVDHWDLTMAINLEAPVFLTRDLLPALRDDGGSIINVSSRAGVLPFEGQIAYAASKFGLEAFSRCLALEVADESISVNTVTPGLRIKPTSVTQADSEALAEFQKAMWYDPVELSPAFNFLAGLRGQVTGCRFDARVLTEAINRSGVVSALRDAHKLAEHVPEGAQ